MQCVCHNKKYHIRTHAPFTTFLHSAMFVVIPFFADKLSLLEYKNDSCSTKCMIYTKCTSTVDWLHNSHHDYDDGWAFTSVRDSNCNFL